MDIVAIISFAIKVMFGEHIIQISCACIFYVFYLFLHLSSGQENKYLRSLKAVQYKNVLYSSFSFTKIPKKSINKIWYIVSPKHTEPIKIYGNVN